MLCAKSTIFPTSVYVCRVWLQVHQSEVAIILSSFLSAKYLKLKFFLPASPQGVSLLGSNFSTSPGSGVQGQGPSANGQLGSMGLSSDGNANDGVAFDINDFPQLSTRQSPSGGLQGGGCPSLFYSSILLLVNLHVIPIFQSKVFDLFG